MNKNYLKIHRKIAKKKDVTLGEALVAATKAEMGLNGGGSRGGGAWPDSDPRALVKEEGRRPSRSRCGPRAPPRRREDAAMHEEIVGRARREQGRPASPLSGVGRSLALPLRRRPMRGGELH